MDVQRLKTKFIRRDVNPEWNEDLTLSIADPNLPIKLVLFYLQFITKPNPYSIPSLLSI